LIGTLQAGYTDFHYLRNAWKEQTEKEALLGVSMTGIASGGVLALDLEEAATWTKVENQRVAHIIGINSSARITTVKPAGTTSLVVGSSSGIHAWHNDYYIRRMRVGKNEPLYKYMVDNVPELIEDCVFKPHLEAVMSFPQKAPEGAMLRTESYKELLERVRRWNLEWIVPGHNYGNNKHNVSCTISLKEDEFKECGDWMWDNREDYTGISVLPFNNGTYQQAPFTDCTKEEFDELFKLLKDIDLSKVEVTEDNTEAKDNLACSGSSCEIQ
jgi:ribonucleoside-diphosphate reductase alpha chain